jgi:S-adenosylmethionine synthetase
LNFEAMPKQGVDRIVAIERKGMGHPDTLADMVADEFNKLYLNYTKSVFGVLLNHHVDKTTLVGAASNTWPGGYEIAKPVTAHFFGKITDQVDSIKIPIHDLASEAVGNILPFVLRDSEITRFTKINIENGAGVQPDHASTFYKATSKNLGIDAGQEQLANDTVIAVGSFEKNSVGAAIIRFEQAIYEGLTPWLVDKIGTDVKVAAFGTAMSTNITACIPVRPEAISSVSQYHELINCVSKLLSTEKERFQSETKINTVTLSINTKDTASGIYIAPFGTALGKGDCGAVGRGNKLSGFINYGAMSSIEAPAGKNPLNHVGKLYQYIAQLLAEELVTLFNQDFATVLIYTQNGRPLDDPHSVKVILADTSSDAILAAKERLQQHLSSISYFWKRLVQTPVITRYKLGITAAMRDSY